MVTALISRLESLRHENENNFNKDTTGDCEEVAEEEQSEDVLPELHDCTNIEAEEIDEAIEDLCKENGDFDEPLVAVSYTHLTLPTKA